MGTMEAPTSDGPAPVYAPTEADEPIFTLHITGLPGDLRQRELFNLFRHTGGYQFCNIRSTVNGISAFATFDAHENAVAAMNKYNGEMFDPDNESCRMKIELAKQNSRKRSPYEPAAGGEYGAAVGQKRSWDAANAAYGAAYGAAPG